ncbi:hypothetical protein BDY17DRAFT_236101, partial [Neohortaea acidophila]
MSISNIHSRSESTASSSSGGSGYQLILDHILSYPGSYEIPLRTMYTLNSTPRAQPSHSGNTSPGSSSGSPTNSQSPFSDPATAKTFNENLMAQLSALPTQPTSLPPSFITSFVRKCFPAILPHVDFPQALTGLDYLKDLETRRRREVAAAMARLDINRNTLASSYDALSAQYPGVAQWIQSIEDKERKIDALYTQLYIGLRRWILINELSLLPFNRHNCYAMLNTLYPPVVTTPPTSTLTSSILKNQRDGFIKYIQSVEKHGPRILKTLMEQGRAPGEEWGWPAVTRTLGIYLQLANSIISDCMEITDVQCISPRRNSSTSERQPRKVDSGVSFNVTEALDSPTAPPEVSRLDTMRPKTPSGSVMTGRSRATSNPRHPTALERLARGLRTIGRSRTDARALRKMRSMGNMN